MKKEWILIAVKTYPTLSEKYIELVCTAGGRTTSTGTSRPGRQCFIGTRNRYWFR